MDTECCENKTELDYFKNEPLQVKLINHIVSDNDIKIASYSIEELNEIINKLKYRSSNERSSWTNFQENWLVIFLLILILLICFVSCMYQG